VPETQRTQVYASPSDLWRLGFPDRIEPADFLPGFVSPVSLIGTSPGGFALSGLPTDAFSFRVKITLAGNLGSARLRFSEDEGITYSPEVILPADGHIRLVTSKGWKSGFSATLTNAVAGTSFLLNDYWEFTTTASAEILDAISVACDYLDAELGNPDNGGRYHLPFLSWPRMFADIVAKIARYNLLAVRGFDFKGKDKLYLDERNWAFNWLSDVKNYRTHPAVIDSTPRTYIPTVNLGPDPAGIIRKTP